MGREVKRVPLDFKWPLSKVWDGYLNPYWDERSECSACEGSGYAPDAKRFADEWYGTAPFDPVAYGAKPIVVDHPAIVACAERSIEGGHHRLSVVFEAARLFKLWRGEWCHHLIQADVDALVAADRLWTFTRVPRTPEQVAIVKAKVAAGGNSWLPESNGYVPTPDEVNDWSMRGMGHDTINQHVCIEARCKREGVAIICLACDGSGDIWSSVEVKQAYLSWQKVDPPGGDGWQMWETVSEGSPISPVMATPEALAAWLADEYPEDGSYKQWLAMIQKGYAMSMVAVGDRLMTGVQASLK